MFPYRTGTAMGLIAALRAALPHGLPRATAMSWTF